MFTLKKIALLSAAGLAAFSMSCSDDGGEDSVDNTISKPIVTLGASGYSLTGGALVESNVGVDSVSINLVNESSVTVPLIGGLLPQTFPTGGELSVNVATLAATYAFSAAVLQNCPAGTTVDAYLEVKGFFKEGPSVSNKSDKITFACESTGPIGPPNIAGAFNDTTEVTLGGTGAAGSAADLDGTPAVYTRAQLNADATLKNKVDVVYNGTNLYSAGAAADPSINGGTLVGTTSEAMLVSVTAAEIAAIDASNTPVATATALATTKLLAGADEFGPATVGANFLVITSEEDIAIVEVKSKNLAVDGVFAIIRSIAE